MMDSKIQGLLEDGFFTSDSSLTATHDPTLGEMFNFDTTLKLQLSGV